MASTVGERKVTKLCDIRSVFGRRVGAVLAPSSRNKENMGVNLLANWGLSVSLNVLLMPVEMQISSTACSKLPTAVNGCSVFLGDLSKVYLFPEVSWVCLQLSL